MYHRHYHHHHRGCYGGGGGMGLLVLIFLAIVFMPIAGFLMLFKENTRTLGIVLMVVGIILWCMIGIH